MIDLSILSLKNSSLYSYNKINDDVLHENTSKGSYQRGGNSALELR
jgi:hypothetical protein